MQESKILKIDIQEFDFEYVYGQKLHILKSYNLYESVDTLEIQMWITG